MYVAVKGGEKAIDAAHALQESRRRGDTDLPELSVAQIEQQLNLAVDRVMTEGGIADRELAALALKQASGDNLGALFLCDAPPAPRWRSWRSVSRSTPPGCVSNGVFQQFIKTFPAANCLAPPTTTPIACSISPCWQTAKRQR